MLKQIAINTNKSYQKRLSESSYLKAAITGAFRRAYHLSITKKVSKIVIVLGTQILQSVVKI